MTLPASHNLDTGAPRAAHALDTGPAIVPSPEAVAGTIERVMFEVKRVIVGQDRLLVVLNLGGRPQGFAIPDWAEGFRVLAAARGGTDPALLGPDEGYVLG